ERHHKQQEETQPQSADTSDAIQTSTGSANVGADNTASTSSSDRSAATTLSSSDNSSSAATDDSATVSQQAPVSVDLQATETVRLNTSANPTSDSNQGTGGQIQSSDTNGAGDGSTGSVGGSVS